MPAVRAVVRTAANDDYRFEALVQGIVSAQAFQMKQLSQPPPDTKQAALIGAERSR
jgi:hypothetical protein